MADLDQLERDGKLGALFDQLAADKPLLVQLPIVGAGKKEQLASIGERLAKAELARQTAALDSHRLPSGRIPMTVLAARKSEGDALKRWSELRHREWGVMLDRELAATRATLAQDSARLAAMPVGDVFGRLAVFASLSALGGAGSPEEAAHRKYLGETKQGLYDSGVRALGERKAVQAEKDLDDLFGLDPAFRDVANQLTLARLQKVELAFREPKGDESVAQAYLLYQSMHVDGRLKGLEKNAEPVALDIRTYYQSLAAAALNEDRLADADALLQRARDVSGLAADVPAMPEELQLVDKTRLLFDQATRLNRHGLALAYLNVIEFYQPDYPQIKKLVREVREKAQEHAQKRVGISAFGGGDAVARFGAAVSAKVAQSLIRQLPNDIRLVERDQLQAVLREQEILAIQNKSALNIVATDLLVQGTLVEASVESEEKKGRQVKRVKTGENTRANPAYLAWRDLSAGERERTPAPPEKLIDPILEDVAINVGVHRKKGILSAAFKLIDSASARVLFTGSETVRQAAEGESSDAVQLGSYVVPMKVAELPSDNEMLGALVDELVGKISSELVGQLKDQEKHYEKLAARHVSEDNHLEAADLYAYASLIAELKRLDNRALLDAMRRQALEVKISG